MPRKFRRVVRKGYSKAKSAKSAKSMGEAQQSGHVTCSEEEEESASCLVTTGSGVQSFAEAFTLTDLHASHPSTDISFRCSTREVSTQTDLCAMQLSTSEASIQTELSTISIRTCTVCTQTEDTSVTCHPVSHSPHQSGKCVTIEYSQYVTHLLYTIDEGTHETAVFGASSSLGHVECEGSRDEKFLPLIERYKGVFKDSSGTNSHCYKMLSWFC